MFRIIVPDAELYFRGYVGQLDGKTVHLPYGDLASGITALMSVNRVFRGHGHQYAWDYRTMKVVLQSVGFVGISRCEFREGCDAKLLFCNQDRRAESLYIEAVKPSPAGVAPSRDGY